MKPWTNITLQDVSCQGILWVGMEKILYCWLAFRLVKNGEALVVDRRTLGHDSFVRRAVVMMMPRDRIPTVMRPKPNHGGTFFGQQNNKEQEAAVKRGKYPDMLASSRPQDAASVLTPCPGPSLLGIG